MRRSDSQRASRFATQQGVTLIELMIAVAIGLVLVTLVLQSYGASSSTASVNVAVSEYQTNGRHALETLKREIRHTALHPMVWDAAQLDANATATARNYGCGAGIATDLMRGITASNDSNPYANSCLAAGTDRQYARGDVLVLRRSALDATTSYDANAPYVRVSYGAANLFLGGESPAELVAPFFDYRLVADTYFINEFTVSAAESPKVPALYRLTLSSGANPTLVPQLVASNVEHLQFQFGQIMDATGGVRYFNANQVTDWSKVSSVRVWLLLRSSNAEPGLARSTYPMGDVTYAPTDSYRRSVLSSTINLRNL